MHTGYTEAGCQHLKCISSPGLMFPAMKTVGAISDVVLYGSAQTNRLPECSRYAKGVFFSQRLLCPSQLKRWMELKQVESRDSFSCGGDFMRHFLLVKSLRLVIVQQNGSRLVLDFGWICANASYLGASRTFRRNWAAASFPTMCVPQSQCTHLGAALAECPWAVLCNDS